MAPRPNEGLEFVERSVRAGVAYVPEDLLTKSTDVTQRTWKRGDVSGIDTKGKLANGNLWRYFGQGNELIRYEDVPAEAAAFFDGLLDKVCFRDRP